ncbi:hypothetical protein Xen7305DRAFT_00039750 [Xenococcus sp. PCC 7305]|uniref:CsbD family protein n=1 Tax=Xenococcus sp. PCC 7305 TaxID=102125 RepID=UPI0002ABEF71|nr:CsbD family protein [Xenococcus sp. PCC 7305]ELS04247.1 hypothetical protein Xen7305DRAFT_00039750 [Xenococcus sp. PCC 7305]
MFSTITTVSNLRKIYLGKLAILAIAIAFAMLAWANLFLNFNIDANAATLENPSLIFAIEGVSDQIEGKVQEDIGTVQRNLGKVTGQAKGALKQAKGKAKQDIGTVKNELDNAADNAEDASEGFINSVKNLFN